MPARLDHLVVVVRSLSETVPEFVATGFTVLPGGRHLELQTENALVVFADGGYLELLATCEPATRDELRALRASARWDAHLRGVSAVARRFLPLLAGDDGVADWVLRSEGLARDAAALRARGLVAAGPVAMERERMDGEKLAWELLLPGSFLHPFRIADRTPRARRVPAESGGVTHANGATGVSEVVVRAVVPPMAALELADQLGTVPRVGDDGATRLDLGDWSVRLEQGAREGACGARIRGVRTLLPALLALGLAPGD